MSSVHLKSKLSKKQLSRMVIRNNQIANAAVNLCLDALAKIRDNNDIELGDAREIASKTINRITGKPKETKPATESTP